MANMKDDQSHGEVNSNVIAIMPDPFGVKKLAEKYELLTVEQKIAAASVIIPHVLNNARDGGSFRHLIYDLLNFPPSAYGPLCAAGVLDATNELVAAEFNDSPQGGAVDGPVTAALNLIEAHALTRPMEPSGYMNAQGGEIQNPSSERMDWFNALWTLRGMASSARAQQEAYDRLKSECDMLRQCGSNPKPDVVG